MIRGFIYRHKTGCFYDDIGEILSSNFLYPTNQRNKGLSDLAGLVSNRFFFFGLTHKGEYSASWRTVRFEKCEL